MGRNVVLTERQKLIDTYLKGAANLYGFVTPRHFLKLFNKYNSPKLLKSELMDSANMLVRNSGQYYDIYDDAIISSRVPDEKITEILIFQQHKNYYMPTEEELLLRSNGSYYERTPQVQRLINYFINKFKISPLIVDTMIYKLIFAITIEERLQVQMDIIESYNIIFKNSSELNSTFQLIVDVSNNTRKWSNCGFTPKELSKEM